MEVYGDLWKYKGGLKDKCQELEVKIISMERTAEREREAKSPEILKSMDQRAVGLKNFLYRLLNRNLSLRKNLEDPTYVYLKDNKSPGKNVTANDLFNKVGASDYLGANRGKSTRDINSGRNSDAGDR